jgi:hypothetical protein
VALPTVTFDTLIQWLLFPANQRTVLIQQVVIAGLVVAAICVLGPLTALGLAALTVAGLLVMVLPSTPVVITFVLLIAFTHQFRSFFTIQLAGIELHPREFLLAGLLAHTVAKFWLGRIRLCPDPIDALIACVGAFFAFAAFSGFVQQRDWHLIVAEIRSPVFLLSYFVFVALAGARNLHFYVRTLTMLTLLLALVSIVYFAYAVGSGQIVSTQNVLGEFVQRRVQGVLVPSVRPAGHMYYEVCLVVFLSLVFCSATTVKRRLLYLGCVALLSIAVVLTMMRTAYVSVAVSLIILAFLSLPGNRVRFAVAWSGMVAVAVGVGLFSTVLSDSFLMASSGLEVSIQARVIEISGAFQEFLRNPLFGTGLGSTFEALGLATRSSQIAYTQTTFQTIHNVWMYYLFKGGLVGGAIILLGLGGLFVETCRRVGRCPDPVQRCFMRGLAAALGAQLLASAGMPRLLYPKGYVFIAMVAAYVVLATPRSETGARQHSVGTSIDPA